MSHTQAIIITCDDPATDKPLKDFCENTLNLYAVEFSLNPGGAKRIFDGYPGRDKIFNDIKKSVEANNTEKIILINHTNCIAYDSSGSFSNLDQEIHEMEIQLRHAVSETRAQFPQVVIEAYLMVMIDPVNFRKVV